MTKKSTKKLLCCITQLSTNMEWQSTDGPTSPERPKQIQRRLQQIWSPRPIPNKRSEFGLKAKIGCTVVNNTHSCSKIEVHHSLHVKYVTCCYTLLLG